jgi:voltage-dependent anion channel protein 2
MYTNIEGLKIELLTTLLPSINEKAAKVNIIHKQPNLHTIATLDLFKVFYNYMIYIIYCSH